MEPRTRSNEATMTPTMTTLTPMTPTTFKASLKKAGAEKATAPVEDGVGIASACQEHERLRCQLLLLLRFYLEIQDKNDLNLTPSFAIAIVIPTDATHTLTLLPWLRATIATTFISISKYETLAVLEFTVALVTRIVTLVSLNNEMVQNDSLNHLFIHMKE